MTDLSQRLDAVIYLLESEPPIYLRWALTLYKTWLEQFIPARNQ